MPASLPEAQSEPSVPTTGVVSSPDHTAFLIALFDEMDEPEPEEDSAEVVFLAMKHAAEKKAGQP